MSDSIVKVSRNTKDAPFSSSSTQSVAFSHYNNISAQLPIDPKTGEIVIGDVKEQAKQCLSNIKNIVESINHTMNDVVKINIFVTDISFIESVNEVYSDFFDAYLPVRTTVAVKALPMSDALIQMDALISNGEGTPPQASCALIKLARGTDKAPTCPLSTQSVAFSHYNNISAQLPIDPETGNIISGGIHQQTEQCLKNIKNILESIDVPFDDIVKVNIFVKNLSDIDAVNEIYTTFFPDSAIARTVAYMPARTIVSAKELPMGALIQIDAVVSHGDGTPPQAVEDRHGIVIRANNTASAPHSDYSTQTVAFSHYNHISAQLPIDPRNGKVIDGDVVAQAKQCINNIKNIIESIDHVMDDVVKVNIQLKNIMDLDAVEKVYTSFFNHDLPAKTVIGVDEIPMGAEVQIDMVVSNGEGTPPQP